MLRSLMTAVTGVRAHQVMLDVTGNNIANVNTTGFKKDFTIFQDLLYQTNQGASGPGDSRGGINPNQVGLGVKVGAIETIHSQGYAQYTGNKSDMMIAGEGYFVFKDGNSQIYSRAGNFTLDAGKTLVHSGTGYRVQGYQMLRDPLNPMNFVSDGALSDIVIPMGDKLEARATTIVGFKCNLDSRSAAYLPIGFADIPYVFPRYSGDDYKASIKIDGYGYLVDFNSKPGAATNYLTITLAPESGLAPAAITFDIEDIKNGLPVLGNFPATIPLNHSSTVTDTGNVIFDSETGLLKIQSAASGATVWETNLYQNMNYTSFSMQDKSTSPPTYFDCIAEFDEFSFTEPGQPAKLRIYAVEQGSSVPLPKTVFEMEAFVPLNSDGTFDGTLNSKGERIIEISAVTGFPGALVDNDFRLMVSANGRGLEFQVSNDPTSGSTDASFTTCGSLVQGGFHTTKLDVFDCQGFRYTLEVQYKKLTANHWRWEAFFVDEKGETIGSLSPTPSSGELFFDASCNLMPPLSTDIEVPFSLLGRENSKITLDFGGASFGLDTMQGVTQFASDSTTKGYYQDGYQMGVLYDWYVGKDGTIVGRYTNDQSLPIYRVALAQFVNPMGLEKVGDTMFRSTVNSGLAVIDPAATNGGGTIEGGSLEMSNVDLTEEFTRLIISQRGFQANTRVVTTSDHILEEVVNLKR